jgi:hypothetical protein
MVLQLGICISFEVCTRVQTKCSIVSTFRGFVRKEFCLTCTSNHKRLDKNNNKIGSTSWSLFYFCYFQMFFHVHFKVDNVVAATCMQVTAIDYYCSYGVAPSPYSSVAQSTCPCCISCFDSENKCYLNQIGYYSVSPHDPFF